MRSIDFGDLMVILAHSELDNEKGKEVCIEFAREVYAIREEELTDLAIRELFRIARLSAYYK